MKHSVFTLLISIIIPIYLQAQEQRKSDEKWFPRYDFDVRDFKNPNREFGPFARWWWPGNDVNQEELRREINLFADNGFGGVEIQPFSINVPMLSEETRNRIMSWDSPTYYQNVIAVLKEASAKGLMVDMTNGSGWPAGGSYLSPEDGFINLLFAEQDIRGGEDISLTVPEIENNTGVASKLIAVLAVKSLRNKVEGKTVMLDPNSTIILTEQVDNGILHLSIPEGDWKIIAFWSKPNSLTGTMTASPEQGPVLNHFDSIKVFKNYDYLFGSRTGLEKYYGNPLRAVFNDSYEFTVDRHFSNDFIGYFKEHRGYDITPWLPANMQEKYNYVSFKNPNAAPDFSYDKEDWRLRYDYDITLSELFGEHFIRAGGNWLEAGGMLLRTQAYGMRMDLMANAGLASVPETESMLGSEANLKLMTSGAHLYNRPVISAESVVFIRRGYMTTPQKIRLAVDKLFTAGVNQIIYHGIPYRYITPETTDLGWYPFYFPFIDFSSHLGEGTQFWKYQKGINKYISRVQYALRSGRPRTDVLLYYPFLLADMPDNSQEILTKGYVEGAEAPLPEANASSEKTEMEAWAEKVYPIINQLEEKGIAWDWINDASIQEADIDNDKQINIRGNFYQALILIDIPTIQIASAEKIAQLSEKGMNLLAVGNLPSKQPSFLNWQSNDRKTAEYLEKSLKGSNSFHIQSINDLSDWMSNLRQQIKFNGTYPFTRQIQREMEDGSRIQFIWNMSENWEPLEISINDQFKSAYWMDAESGIVTAISDLDHAKYIVPPFSTVILYVIKQGKLSKNDFSNSESNFYGAKELFKIDNWDLTVDTVRIEDTTLFNWKAHDELKYMSQEGVYTSGFKLDKLDRKGKYFIDFGEVYFTAELLINGVPAGERINAPYIMDISRLIKKGENRIEIHVLPGQLNGLIGLAANGNPGFSAFKGKESNLMSGGIVGPVSIWTIER